MIDKEKLHQILSSLWKNDDGVGKTHYNQALQDVQTAIDLQEEPVSEKKCMFTKNSYTDEDRKVLCDGCEEECKYARKEEPVSEQKLSNVERTVKNRKEPVSEELEKIVEEIAEPTILNAYGTKELARRLRNTIYGISTTEDLGEYINELSKQFPEVSFAKLSRIAVRVAKWQKQHTVSMACQWLDRNVTFTHPRKGTEECIINLGKFKEAMMED